ncbi:hypothetical protein I7I48_04592 [Histoplasma ohiense]|nr:hypothetical protein I7I48_04592 [Histoplasma ohiense (nom. inval.)]
MRRRIPSLQLFGSDRHFPAVVSRSARSSTYDFRMQLRIVYIYTLELKGMIRIIWWRIADM